MENTLISVVVPVYNSEKYLKTCVQSILRQTHRHLELILVDDGSADAGGRLCDDFAAADERVRVIHKPNGGVSSARNAGLAVCRGAYIAFADSDDTVEPSFLAEALAGITESGAQLYICGLVMESEREPPEKLGGPDRVYPVRALLEARGRDYPVICISGVWCKLFRADVIRQHQLRFDETMTLGEDACFVYDYLARIRCVRFADRYLYRYRRGSGDSLYSRYNEDFYGQYVKTIARGLRTAGIHQCSGACLERLRKEGAGLLMDSLMKEYKFYERSSGEKRRRVFHLVARHPLMGTCSAADFSTLPRRLLFLAIRYRLYPAAHVLLWIGRLVGKTG